MGWLLLDNLQHFLFEFILFELILWIACVSVCDVGVLWLYI